MVRRLQVNLWQDEGEQPGGIRRIPSATHASLPAGIRDRCSCTRATAAVSRPGRSCASTYSTAAVSNAGKGNRLERPRFADRRLFARGLQCTLRLLYIRIDVRSRLQCAERVESHAAHRCSGHGGRSSTKFGVMHVDPCDQGLPKPGEPETLIPKVTQQTLADMIGTTRSRVGFFMNRFRKLGFIECNGRIRIHKSLLNVILHNQSSEDHPVDAPLFGIQAGLAKPARNGTASVATIEENED